MSKDRVRTVPNFADSSPAHQAALEAGTDHFSSWQFNVEDRFKGKPVEEIKKTLQTTAHPFAVLCEHLIGDFNFSAVIRAANGFNAREVFYLGDKKFDKRGAVGAYNYVDVKWLPSIDDLIKLRDTYTFVGIDNVPGSVPMETFQWKYPSLLIFGEEGCGLTPTMQGLCDNIVAITMYGSVRSFNVATASGICMYDFVSKYRGTK